METCRLGDFLNVLEPWLDTDYIRKVFLDTQGRLVLFFADGGERVYSLDDCTQSQLKDILEKIENRGIPVETQ
ncbi:hypothetical protein D3OALGA1CA_2836 [Olavius algarvensis associated proteobacterium Delta 3]|nr:hypothetical protein D3OALGA1CA_2836 [Olavius algarvensis associated proteobacterium Delta 3]CAB5163539.1 hypothetical protein D3OALGB2SA_5589 [Olavius algarvensis associated proteobacterium Delta 3]